MKDTVTTGRSNQGEKRKSSNDGGQKMFQDHVYSIGSTKQASDYVLITLFIITLILKTFTEGDDIADLLMSDKEPNQDDWAPKLKATTGMIPPKKRKRQVLQRNRAMQVKLEAKKQRQILQPYIREDQNHEPCNCDMAVQSSPVWSRLYSSTPQMILLASINHNVCCLPKVCNHVFFI